MFPDAGRVVIDRSPNRHAAFGLGIHRCLGSNLARGSRKSLTSRWPRMGWLNGRPEVCADRAPCRSYLAQIDGFQVPRPPPGCEALLQPTHAARFPAARGPRMADQRYQPLLRLPLEHGALWSPQLCFYLTEPAAPASGLRNGNCSVRYSRNAFSQH